MPVWSIESISIAGTPILPTKEEMETFVPSKLPSGWEVIEKHLKDGVHSVRLGHINPKPANINDFYQALAENPYVPAQQLAAIKESMQAAQAATNMDMTPGGKHDYYTTLSITGYPDNKTARQYFENYDENRFLSLDASVPGTAFDISIGELLEAFAPKELAKEAKEALGKAQKSLAKSGIKTQAGKFLGEDALFIIGKNGRRVCQAVLINNFIIMGDILGYSLLPPGNTPVHSVLCQTAREKHNRCQCNFCKSHPACSTLQAEDFIHQEKVESLLQDVFARIKEATKKHAKETEAIIIVRGKEKIRNPEEKCGLENGDVIKTNDRTQINIADNDGNKITIGNKTEAEISSVFNLKLISGTITAFLNKLKPKTKFEVHTPISITSIRGTIFSLFTDENTTTLTVIEGEVELSDLKGNKVRVMSNQTCICSKGQGLQKPVTLPINLTEQYKRK
jgi:hypothetical protein